MADINIEKFKSIEIDLSTQTQKIGEDNCTQMESEVKANAQTILDKGYATGKYKNGWVTEPTLFGAILKNTGDHTTLSHLLENGHRSRGGTFVPPQPHIRPAYQKIKKQYLDDIYNIRIEVDIK